MPVCVAVCRIPYGQLKEKGVHFCLTASVRCKVKIRCCGKIDTSWLHGRLAALTRLDLIGSCKCSVAVVAANQRSLFQRSRVTHCN